MGVRSARCATLALAVASLFGGALAPARAAAQDMPQGVEEGWELDPYTRGDPELARAAGYVRLGEHMVWGDDHGTREILPVLGAVPMIWAETAHFRIGSSLPEQKIGREEKDALRKELERLSERLPEVDERTKTLDRWLRLHLYAQRLEDTYAELAGVLGVTDADFPPEGFVRAAPAAPAEGGQAAPAAPFMGEGPYLGQRGKYLVLLFEKKSSLGRYAARCGSSAGGEAPFQHAFPGNGSMLLATTSEFFEGRYANDVALHCHVNWNVVQLLLCGFKGYYHALPRWTCDGLAYWSTRRVSEDFPSFSQLKEPSAQVSEENDWPRKVRARVKAEVYPDAGQVLRWRRGEPLPFADHMMMWSRVDYLTSQQPQAFARILSRMKDPIPLGGRIPDEDDVFTRQDEAFAAEQLSPDAFDEAWAAWVLKTYPKR